MFKHLLLISAWFTTTLVTLIASLFLYQTVAPSPALLSILPGPTTTLAYAALPSISQPVSLSVITADARPVMIEKYFNRYNSPLAGYGQFIVTTADQHRLDPYLFVAIAQQESNLCKKIPSESYNCWGWGIHSRGTLKFTNYEQAITTVIQGLTEDYLGKGLTEPADIMTKYTPLSNGSWAAGVNQFLEELRSGQF